MKLRDLAYYRTGGRCLAFYEPKNIQDLAKIVAALHATRQPYFVLGGGTNSLVLDEDWPGAVITFTRMKRLEVRGEKIFCEAGVENSDVAQAALGASLEGAAWMYRLPGQSGGTVRMNARCYGGEISQIATVVDTVLRDGTIRSFSVDEGIFKGYKDTLFMENGAIIAGVTLQLKSGDKAAIDAQMRFCEADRIKKGQFTHPTCGCVFKNDYSVGVSSGLLLDKAGAHGLSHETVMINPQHANFVYNMGAQSREILEMSFRMRELVYKEFGVWLQYEMEILGALPMDLQSKLEEHRPYAPKEDKLKALREEFTLAQLRQKEK